MKKLTLFLMIIITLVSGVFLIRPTPIPHRIHYVWVGRNPLPLSAQKAIDSWKKYAPRYRTPVYFVFNQQTILSRSCPAFSDDFTGFFVMMHNGITI